MDQIMMFSGQTRVRYLKRIKYLSFDQPTQIRQLARYPNETNEPLLTEGLQQFNETIAPERLDIPPMKLQEIKVVGSKSSQTCFKVGLNDCSIPVVIYFQMIRVLGVNTTAFSG